MAKSENGKSSEPEHVDNTLDTVLISALQENFEIKNGYHVDRNEILEFLRSVIKEHPELNFVLQHRDTKLSSRIYKAFPKVTTKRVAVPNIRGKKTWTYTNLRRITSQRGSPAKQDVKSGKTQVTRSSNIEVKETTDGEETPVLPSTKRERRPCKSKRVVQSASMVQRDSLFDTYKREREDLQKSSRTAGNIPQHSYLGRYNDMLKWVKEHYVLDTNSSIQVKHIVESIKAEFKINITYKQSHKLIFAVFPGTTNRVEHPVKIEAQGGFYSYKGIAPQPKGAHSESEEAVVAQVSGSSPDQSQRQNVGTSASATQACVQADSSPENGRKRIFRTRKRFIEACAVLKPAEEALASHARYDVTPIHHEFAPMASEVSPKFSGVSPRLSDASSRVSDVSSRLSDVSPKFSDAPSRTSEASPRFSDVSPRIPELSPRISEGSLRRSNFSSRHSEVSPVLYEVPPIVSEEMRRCENSWQRLYEELKQERDQAIMERNQAMVTLMEVERDQTTRTPDDLSRHQATVSDVDTSSKRLRSKSEGRENPDWLGSLISRSSTILGEQMSEANAVYFPGSTLQNNSCNQRYPKRTGYRPGDYLEIERYEQLKRERDAIWKNWIDKLAAEKDNIIQQLKLDKMEVIQRMELEKTDAVECIEEKLTNQITILTRETRELKELLNHTMNERTLAIEHAHKLMELAGREKVKEAGLENLPFDVTKDQIVHPPKLKTQKASDEGTTQKALVCFGKGNKRKQSMPAKLKKMPRLDASVSAESEDYADNIPKNSSETVSTDSRNLITDTGSTCPEPAADSCDDVAIDDGPVDYGVIDRIDAVSTDTINNIAASTVDAPTINNGETDQSIKVSITPVTGSDKVMPETQIATSPKASESVSPGKQTVNNTVTNAAEHSSTEISEKLESPKTQGTNMNISEKSDITAVTSTSRNISDNTTTVRNISTNFENQIESEKTVNSIATSCSEKSRLEISETVNAESVNSRNDANSGNSDISAKNSTATSVTDSWTLKLDSENLAENSGKTACPTSNSNNIIGKLEYLIPVNARKYLSETSGNYTSNSGKCVSEPAQTANFPKYMGEIQKKVSTVPFSEEVQKPNPQIPRTILASTDSAFSSQVPKSFEESVNSTFLKYFPEIPKRSFSESLTAESGKYFRDIPSTVGTAVGPDSQKYIKDSGNQALVYPDEESFSEGKKVSSIDFLSSMVENIGKSPVE